MNTFDKQIANSIKQEKLTFSTNEASKSRLMYHMQLKSAQVEVRKNAILPSLASLFAGKFMMLKLGSIAAFFLFFFGYQQMNQQSSLMHLSDTVQVNQTVDTLSINFNDSLLIN